MEKRLEAAASSLRHNYNEYVEGRLSDFDILIPNARYLAADAALEEWYNKLCQKFIEQVGAVPIEDEKAVLITRDGIRLVGTYVQAPDDPSVNIHLIISAQRPVDDLAGSA